MRLQSTVVLGSAILIAAASPLFAVPVISSPAEVSATGAPQNSSDPIPAVIEFNRDIRPVLSEHCFACHGFDKNKRKADLRLDVHESLLKSREGGSPVVAGRPDESLVYQRIMSADPDEQMPPPESKKPLSDRQKKLLRAWIEQGAAWQDHWSFMPVQKPKVPDVPNRPAAEIDAFVQDRLIRSGLAQKPQADKTTLIRRVTLDLTGLPPTIEEVDAFLADTRPDAYERLVDRLLGSVRHAERLTLDWLDAARFADTHGYHIDAGRDMTRWRDWVIDAFHENKPYDQFTIEQLAGDLLPDAATPEETLKHRIASGFNRNNMVNFEGGAIPEEYRTAYVIDRVNTTGTVWLGLTVGCTQCHDHKFDPITQKEYYGLFAFFNSIEELGLDGREGNAVPFVRAPSGQQLVERDRLNQVVSDLEKQFTVPLQEADTAQAAWEASLGKLSTASVTWDSPSAGTMEAAGKAQLTQLPDQSITATERNGPKETYTVQLKLASLQRLSGFRLEALPDAALPAQGPGRSSNGNFVLTDIKVALRHKDGSSTPLPIGQANADFSQRDFDIALAIDESATTGWAISPETGKPHQAIFELKTPATTAEGDEAVVSLAFRSAYNQHQLGHFRLGVTGTDHPAAVNLMPEAARTSLSVAAADRTAAQAASLRDYFRRQVWLGGQPLLESLQKARQKLADFEKSVPTAMVMKEMDRPRETHVLMRGAYDAAGESVQPGTPAFLPPLPKDRPADRLSLARWLVDPKNPLTARVTVNRYWQMFFGTGIVKTVEDFGSQGELPSHPELLDWLASDFVEHGWNVRRLIRQIVTSRTYCQSSVVSPAAQEADPENRLLARGPRFRLPAEFIRDQALAVSGLLDSRIGGASVSPYQPAGLWEELMSRADGEKWTAQTYSQSHGPDLYRRTMYTFWKRTCPPPTLSTFDAPDREVCTVRRARTNTPLQALVLMNDPTYIESARKLAERVLTDGNAASAPSSAARDDSSRIRYLFRTVLSRPPREDESAVLTQLLERQRTRFASDLPAAGKLLKVGDAPVDKDLAPEELAAWTTVASVILNLDEAVTRG